MGALIEASRQATYSKHEFGVLRLEPDSEMFKYLRRKRLRRCRQHLRKNYFGGHLPDAVIISYLGNNHNIFALPQHPDAFDFHLPGEQHTPIEPGYTRIGFSQVYHEIF